MPWFARVIENSWVFPALEATHVVALALLVGSIALGDMRVLGWISESWTQADAPARFTRAGLWLMVLTGLPMFLAGVDRYRENPAFLVKMAALVVTLGVHHTVHKRATRATAALSLALWTFMIFAARAVIDFDV